MNEGSIKQQYGALVWRNIIRPETLLITSRDTRRWIIPKGMPMRGLNGAECAAQEAFEEAGVKGPITDQVIGSFLYHKAYAGGRSILYQVQVYSLALEGLLITWPEAHERTRQWFSFEDAARLVQEPDLAQLITAFSAAIPKLKICD